MVAIAASFTPSTSTMLYLNAAALVEVGAVTAKLLEPHTLLAIAKSPNTGVPRPMMSVVVAAIAA